MLGEDRNPTIGDLVERVEYASCLSLLIECILTVYRAQQTSSRMREKITRVEPEASRFAHEAQEGTESWGD